MRRVVRSLYLLRHAKSSWDDPALADRDRPLAPRGRKATRLIRRYLAENAIHPELILCSPSTRTRQTLEGIEPALGESRLEIEPGLYGASAGELLRRLQRVPDGIGSVMIVAHNPGLEELATMLARTGDALPALHEKFPTGALATLLVPGGWRDLAPATAELSDYVWPRKLA